MNAVFVVQYDDQIEYSEDLGFFTTREAATAALPALLSAKHLTLTDAVDGFDHQPTVSIFSIVLDEPANYNYEGHWYVKLKEG